MPCFHLEAVFECQVHKRCTQGTSTVFGIQATHQEHAQNASAGFLVSQPLSGFQQRTYETDIK